MPIRSASSTCVSFRWRRSCRIFRPTSSTCAGLFIRVRVDFYAIAKYSFGSPKSRGSPKLVSIPTTPAAARNLHLFHQLVRRDFAARFTGSALGLGWAVLQPLTLVVLYWFVFTFMIPQGPGSKDNGYVLFLIAGLVPWIGFNEGIMRSTTSIVDN